MGIRRRWTGRAPPAVVALDIGSTRVKLLELSRELGRYRVESYASEALPPQAVAGNPLAEPTLVGQAIAQTMQRSGCRLRRSAVAVPGSAAISKRIDVPAGLSDHEIEQHIGFDADHYIPYPIEEVSLDFQVLGRSERNPEMQAVLLTACRRDTVELRVAAVEIAGLKASVVDIEPYALQNAARLLVAQMPERGAGSTVAMVEVGASNTAVHLLHDGDTVYTREQPFGGTLLVEEIQRHYRLAGPEQALQRLHAGELDPEFREQAISGFAGRIARQIERSLQFFFSSSTRHDRVDRVLLLGGCALLPGIEGRLARELDLPVVVGNPLAGMAAATKARRNRVVTQGPALMVATGLALRSFAPA